MEKTCHLFKKCFEGELDNLKFEVIKDYGEIDAPNDCMRKLLKCPECGALFLSELLEWDANNGDNYYRTLVQVDSVEEADDINSNYGWHNLKSVNKNMILNDCNPSVDSTSSIEKSIYFRRKKVELDEILNEYFPDIFWKELVRKYIEVDYRDNEEYAVTLLQEISTDDEVLDEFCKSLVQETRKTNNEINLKFDNIQSNLSDKKKLDIYYMVFMLMNRIPLVKIDEYNVTANIEDRDALSILVYNRFVLYNNEYIFNKELFGKVRDVVINYKASILNFSKMKLYSSKGGRQKKLYIYENEKIGEYIKIIGNSDNEEVNGFYDEFKNMLVEILNDNK